MHINAHIDNFTHTQFIYVNIFIFKSVNLKLGSKIARQIFLNTKLNVIVIRTIFAQIRDFKPIQQHHIRYAGLFHIHPYFIRPVFQIGLWKPAVFHIRNKTQSLSAPFVRGFHLGNLSSVKPQSELMSLTRSVHFIIQGESSKCSFYINLIAISEGMGQITVIGFALHCGDSTIRIPVVNKITGHIDTSGFIAKGNKNAILFEMQGFAKGIRAYVSTWRCFNKTAAFLNQPPTFILTEY